MISKPDCSIRPHTASGNDGIAFASSRVEAGNDLPNTRAISAPLGQKPRFGAQSGGFACINLNDPVSDLTSTKLSDRVIDGA
jgi:hypothetical protein